jgi:metal-responsive CopG/Arc/MetJ family transcriptional regulator
MWFLLYIFNHMRNVQISIDEKMLAELERVGKPLGLKRSQIVRQALREWLHRHAVQRFEQDWIRSVESEPDQAERADDWIGIQASSEK